MEFKNGGVDIKRPLVFIACTFYAGILCASKGLWQLLPISALLAAAAYFLKRIYTYNFVSNIYKYIIAFIIIFSVSFIYGSIKMVPPEIIFNLNENEYKAAWAEGIVESVSVKDYGTLYILKACRVNLTDENVYADNLKIVVSKYDSDCYHNNVQSDKNKEGNKQKIEEADIKILPGDRISVRGKVSLCKMPRNDGEFNQNLYYKSKGIFLRFTSQEIQITEKCTGIQKMLSDIKQRVANIYDSAADKRSAGFLKGIVLGDRDGIEQEQYNLYKRNGIAHLLAISGLHVSLIGMSFYKILRRAGVSYFVSFCAASAFLVMYVILTGNGVSAGRALIMCIVSVGADVLGKTYDIFCALSLSGIILALKNVYVFYDMSFLLSFAAILGIAVLHPIFHNIFLLSYSKKIKDINMKINPYKKRAGEICIKAADAFLGSTAISLFTLPLILYQNFEFPLYSPFINIIAIPLMTLLFICAIAAAVAGLFSVWAASFFLGGANCVLSVYELLCRMFEAIPDSRIVTGKPELSSCIIFYIIIFLFVVFAKKYTLRKEFKGPDEFKTSIEFKGSTKFISVILGLLLFLAVIILLPKQENKLIIDMIDTGQGESVLLRSPGGINVLFDGGSTDIKNVGEKRIYPLIKSKKVTCIDYIFISHPDMDHTSGIIELMNMQERVFKIKNIVLPDLGGKEKEDFKEIINLASGKEINVICMKGGDFLDLGDGVNLTCLNPVSGFTYENVNDYSLVISLKYKKFTALFTGDIGACIEKLLLMNGKIKQTTMLKAAHHGSDSSSDNEFIEKVSPQLAIISCGIDNRYGHPAKQTVDKLKNIKAFTYITSDCGQITIKSDGNAFNCKTYYR